MGDVKPPLFLPSRLVIEGVRVPDGWRLDPVRDGYVPPETEGRAKVEPPNRAS